MDAKSARDAELARRVYARAWPVTCRDDYVADEIIARLGERDLAWWQRKLAHAAIAIAGGPARGGYGFVVVEKNESGRCTWDVTYMFCEPEAFGTGLAQLLGTVALESLGPNPGTVGSWILAGNKRSQAAAEKLGWKNRGIQTPPWGGDATFYRYELEVG